MKKQLILAVAIMTGAAAYGQVGINTAKPKGMFHIDGTKDNPINDDTPTAAQQLNDFTILSNGNVGIGTITPAVKLDINTGGTAATPSPGFSLVDGNQGATKVLTSNANGVGTWQTTAIPVYRGTFSGANVYSDKEVSGNNYLYLNTSITLPKGQWAVNVGMTFQSNMVNNNRIWDHIVVTTDPTNLSVPVLTGVTAIQAPYIATNNIVGNSNSTVSWHNYSIIQGTKVYTVTADSVTLYFLSDNSSSVTQGWLFSPGNWENYLYAISVVTLN